jgi:hypothetical protein
VEKNVSESRLKELGFRRKGYSLNEMSRKHRRVKFWWKRRDPESVELSNEGIQKRQDPESEGSRICGIRDYCIQDRLSTRFRIGICGGRSGTRFLCCEQSFWEDGVLRESKEGIVEMWGGRIRGYGECIR